MTTEPLSAETLARMRADHFTAPAMNNRSCCYCGCPWPCDPALLLAELDRREAQDRWRGRNHVTPVLATFSDVRERVTGLREHDGISCCEWATDGPCPWSKQGVQAALFGPTDDTEFTARGSG